MTGKIATLAVSMGLLTGCALEPAYHRPAPPVPAVWPAGPAYGAPTDLSVTDWGQVFPDPKLRRVIEQALANSRDLRVAIAQIQASRAQYRVQRAALFPTIDASAGVTTGRDSGLRIQVNKR